MHKSQGSKVPASEHLMSEPNIVVELAKATFDSQFLVPLKWNDLSKNYDHIRDLIEKTIPGFENFNKRVRINGGFYLPNETRNGKFNTSSSKAHFTINTLADHRLKEGEFLMMTIRSHDQYNTTIYGLDDRYRGIHNGRRIVFMNEKDAQASGLRKGDVVDIVSLYDNIPRKAENFTVVPYNIPSQNVATYFPESNAVVPHNHFARGSRTPISKSVVIRLISAAEKVKMTI